MSATIDLCITISEECPITYLITADNQVEFSFGGSRGGCHCAFRADTLRTFLSIGTEALAKLEARTPPT